MPNWCYNELTVSGGTETLKQFLDACMGLPARYTPVILENGQTLFGSPEYTEKRFCFNALIPTPDEVLAIGYDAHDKVSIEDMANVLLGKKTGQLDGYHWNIANWGTKWDIYCDGITLEDTGWTDGCDSVTFDFETAWSPPVAWLQTAVARYPELSFKLHYEETGCCFAGDILGEAGETTDIPYNDDQLRELFDWDDEEDA